MKIIVIIVTFNGAHWIEKCFGSLINSTIPIKVIAIDNASTDGTPDIIRKKYPNVEVIETGKNLGFGKANNIGFKRALSEESDFVFLLNQDASIQSNTISELIKIAIQNPEFGILSPIHLNGKGDKLDQHFKNYLLNTINSDIYSDIILNSNRVNKLYELDFVNAAAWLIRKNVLESVGGFDPLFEHYGEDEDYINRLKYHNKKIGIVTNTFIFHDRDNRLIEWNTQRKFITHYLIPLKNINIQPEINYSQKKWLYFKLKIKFHLTTDPAKKNRLKERLEIINLLIKDYYKIIHHREKCKKLQPNFLISE